MASSRSFMVKLDLWVHKTCLLERSNWGQFGSVWTLWRKIKNRLECSKRIIWWRSTFNDTPGDRYRISFLESWYFEPNRKSTKSRRRSETNLFYQPKTIILTFSIIWKNNSWDIQEHRCRIMVGQGLGRNINFGLGHGTHVMGIVKHLMVGIVCRPNHINQAKCRPKHINKSN